MFQRLLLCSLCVSLPILPVQGEDLFDGKSLEGWSGDPRLWRVEDGAIVGETDTNGRKIEANTFLIWQGGEVGDFEITLKARVVGNNSGLQYRCKIKDAAKWSATGYQLDMHPKQEYLGMLYEEGGRGISCLRGQKVELVKGGKPAITGKLDVPEVDLSKWNEFRLVVRGNKLQHYVNGKLAAEIVDRDPDKLALRGHLALQLHQGPAMKAEFKDLRLTRLEPEAAGAGKPE